MTLTELAHSIWRVGAGRPRVVILGGVHGNERTGVEVVKALVQRFSAAGTSPQLKRGELTLALGNPEAVEKNVRFLDDDLNRCFGRDSDSSCSSSEAKGSQREHRRAAELAPFLSGIDVLVDLHATNKPSAPFARLPGRLSASFFARCEHLFLKALPPHCSTVLWDPQFLIGKGHMSDEFALQQASASDEKHSAYICYEAGLASDTSAIPATMEAVNALLAETGLTGASAAHYPASRRTWTHYVIAEVFILDDRGFEWQNGFGKANFQKVPAGEVYGRRLSDGEVLKYHQDSYIVFPKVESLWGLGKPLGWLATSIPELPE